MAEILNLFSHTFDHTDDALCFRASHVVVFVKPFARVKGLFLTFYAQKHVKKVDSASQYD